MKDLDPGVAYAVLFVIALGIVMFYLGPAIKAKLTPKDEPPKPADSPPAAAMASTQPVPSLPAAMNHADGVTQQFLDHVLRQLRDETAERERLEREVRWLQAELDRMRWQQRGVR